MVKPTNSTEYVGLTEDVLQALAPFAPQTDALTDAQLRASRVPVDVEIDQPLTDAQLRTSPVTVTNPFVVGVSQDKIRLAGSGRVSLSLSGNLRCLVSNSRFTDDGSTNGKSVALMRVAVFTTAVGWGSVIMNPGSGAPGLAARRTKLSALIAGQQGVVGSVPTLEDPMDIRVDTNTTVPLGGGVDTGIVFGLPAGARTTLDLPPLILGPGQAIGINVPFAGAADVSLSIYWMIL